MARIGFVGMTRSTQRDMERMLDQGYNIPVLYTRLGESLYTKQRAIDLTSFCNTHGIDAVDVGEGHIKDQQYVDDVKKRELDLIVQTGWSQLISPEFLKAAKYGGVGLHYSLLPGYPGPSSINWACLLGAGDWGVTLFRMGASYDDSNAIVAQHKIRVEGNDDANTLFDKGDFGAMEMLTGYVPRILDGTVEYLHPSYEGPETRRLHPLEYHINWKHTARQNFNKIRAFTHPFPGAHTLLDEKRAIMYWRAEPTLEYTTEMPGTVLTVTPTTMHVASGKGEVLHITDASVIDRALIQYREGKERVVGNRLQHMQMPRTDLRETVWPGLQLPSGTLPYPIPNIPPTVTENDK